MRDGAEAGLRLVASAPEQAGELLRVSIESLAGRTRETLARVVSCERTGEGDRFEMALEALDTGRPRFVRRETNA
jgi:hypothetical protein